MRRILVTGSEGFIGKSLVRRLEKNSENIVLTVDSKGSGTNHITLNLSTEKLTAKLFSITPDVIIHLAGRIEVFSSISAPKKSFLDNALPGLNAIEFANELSSVNFIYVNSGGATYSEISPLPHSERGHIDPISPYGISKQVVEDVLAISARQFGYYWSSLALANCFGDFNQNHTGVISKFIEHVQKGSPPTIFGADSSRDFIHLEDVVDAILLAIQHPANTRVNVSSGREYNLAKLFGFIAEQFKSDVKPRIESARPGEVIRSSLDNELAFQLWDWKPKYELTNKLREFFTGKQINA
jgi:UDP-glucose 4-epimerase